MLLQREEMFHAVEAKMLRKAQRVERCGVRGFGLILFITVIRFQREAARGNCC